MLITLCFNDIANVEVSVEITNYFIVIWVPYCRTGWFFQRKIAVSMAPCKKFFVRIVRRNSILSSVTINKLDSNVFLDIILRSCFYLKNGKKRSDRRTQFAQLDSFTSFWVTLLKCFRLRWHCCAITEIACPIIKNEELWIKTHHDFQLFWFRGNVEHWSLVLSRSFSHLLRGLPRHVRAEKHNVTLGFTRGIQANTKHWILAP